MPKGTNNARIEVFRVGTFTPMNGKPLSFSASELQSIADVYNPEDAPAPIVVGHPKTDDPAFGWADQFIFDEETGKLSAELKDIVPSFADAVSSGQYKKVSLAFFAPNSAANPKPGTYYPKHIGFLGAVPPAVPGLKPVEFADCDDADVLTFEGSIQFSAFDAENVGTLFQNIRDFIFELKGKEKADEVIPHWRTDWVRDLDLTTEDETTGFAAPENKTEEDNTMSGKTPSVADNPAFAAKEKELDERQARLDARDKKYREDENLNFAESLIEGEQLLPALKDNVVAVLNAAGDADATVSFADQDKPFDLAEGIRSILKAQPKIVNFGAIDMGEEPLNFAKDPQALADAAEAYQAEMSVKGVNVATDVAVEAVLKGANQ